MTLREELARRVWDVAEAADPHPNAGCLEWSDEVGNALADEVIRQMEWARRGRFRTAGSCDGGTVCRGSEMDWIDPVNLAPPDWKP
jgi:hypothetical protein